MSKKESKVKGSINANEEKEPRTENMVKIIDFKNKPKLKELLETSNNPMAMVVTAQLKRYELKKADNNKKSTIKWDLIWQCFKKGYSKDDIRVLIKFIDWLISLPEGLNKQLSKKIEKLEEDYKMPYVTSWERIAKKEGVREGKREGKIEGKRQGKIEGKIEGKRQGKREGKIEGKLEVAKELLINGVSIDIVVKSTGFPREEIEKLAKAVSS